MINGKTVLAIIPARGGSKGIPRKNIKLLAGKPLIAWTIEEARKSKYIDRLILSSEDNEIIEIAKQYGCDVPFKRPKELALDNTPGIEPVIHAINNMPFYDYIVLLQATSPLRRVIDIDSSIEQCTMNNDVAVVSVMETDNNPYWMYKVSKEGLISPLMKEEEIPLRRQDAKKIYGLNGAVYVSTTKAILEEKTFLQKETMAYVMPRERSFDIDNELDFKICEYLIEHLNS